MKLRDVCGDRGGSGHWEPGDVWCAGHRTLLSGLQDYRATESGLFVYIVRTELTQDFVGDVSITKGELSSLSSSMYI